MLQNRLNACRKLAITCHATGLSLTRHPFLQCRAQQAKVMLVHFWRIGLGKRLGMNGFNQRMAVVFIELRPHFRHIVQLRALRNAFPSLTVSFQAAHENSFKL